MKTGKLIIYLFALTSVVFLLACSISAHPFSGNGASYLHFAFYDSILAFPLSPSNNSLLTRGYTESHSEKRLSLFQNPSLSPTYGSAYGKSNLNVFSPKEKKINYKRASIVGAGSAGVIFFGFKHAIDSWGRSNNRFHFKDDWKGDHLGQSDELSHFLCGYKITQLSHWGFHWMGLSSKTSQLLSISESALISTLVEYPIDAYNPKQGFGVSDLVFDYLGVGLAFVKKHQRWLEDFDFKMSWKRNIFSAHQSLFAQTYEEYDNLIYWLTYRIKLFMPTKIFCFGLGYSVTHHGLEPKRQFYWGFGVSVSDFASLFGERFKAYTEFLDLFYPNLCIKL